MKRFLFFSKRGGHVRRAGKVYSLTWPWIICWAVVVAAVIWQFSPSWQLGALLNLVGSLALIGIIVWQHWHLKKLSHRVDRLERMVVQSVSPSKKISKTDPTEQMLDEFFGDRSTRH